MNEFDFETLELLRRVHVNMPWKFLPRYLESVLELRMNVEIGFGAEELDAPRTYVRSTVEQLKKAGCSVSLHGPFWDLSPGSLDPLVRQISRFRLHQFFDLIPLFEPCQVVCHTGFDPRHHRGHEDFYIGESLATWEALAERAEACRTVLLVENVWEQNPDFHRALLQKVDSPYFGFCLDVGHQHSFSQTPLSGWLEELADFIKEIHLHDNDGTHDSHLPVGEGNIDFIQLFGFLGEKGNEPLLTVEPHREEDVAKTLLGLARVLPH